MEWIGIMSSCISETFSGHITKILQNGQKRLSTAPFDVQSFECCFIFWSILPNILPHLSSVSLCGLKTMSSKTPQMLLQNSCVYIEIKLHTGGLYLDSIVSVWGAETKGMANCFLIFIFLVSIQFTIICACVGLNHK